MSFRPLEVCGEVSQQMPPKTHEPNKPRFPKLDNGFSGFRALGNAVLRHTLR